MSLGTQFIHRCYDHVDVLTEYVTDQHVGDGAFKMRMTLDQLSKTHPIVKLAHEPPHAIDAPVERGLPATQHVRYEDRFVAVDLQNPDFAKLADAFGVAYTRADNDDALEAALRTAFATRGTTVIEVRPGDARTP